MNSNNGNFGTGGGMTGSTTSTGERTDWLDKGIQKVGNKLGMNVVRLPPLPFTSLSHSSRLFIIEQ